MKGKLIYGFGVNDSKEPQRPVVDGKQIECIPYQTWFDMERRCYSEKSLAKLPTYRGVEVDIRWKYYTNFRDWMCSQDYHGKYLDKDILSFGGKIYGPDTCVFVDRDTNMFMLERGALRGELPLGVWKQNGKFRASVRNLGRGAKHLGYFPTPEEAHVAWRLGKYNLAVELASRQTDPRIAEALIKRYYVEPMEN